MKFKSSRVGYAGSRAIILPILAAPAMLTATEVTENSITWEWSSVVNATSYVLQRSTNSAFTGAVQVFSGGDLTFQDTGLTTSTTYYYRVRAQASGYTESLWTTNSETTDAGIETLPTPTGLVIIDITSTTIELDWDAVADAEEYVVERDTDPGFGSPTEVYSDAATTFEDTSLTADTHYYYRVKATATGWTDSEYAETDDTTFVTQYQAILTAAIGTAPATLPGRKVDNAFWKDFVDAGYFAIADAAWMMTTEGDGSYALANGVNPGSNTGTLHGTSNPSYVAKEGFYGNEAQSAYINFNWIPSNGVNFQQNDASIHVFTLDNTQHTNPIVGTTNGSAVGRLFVTNKDELDRVEVYVNSTSGATGGTGGPGLISGVRAASGNHQGYRNGVQQSTDTDDSNDLSDNSLIGFAYNNNGTPTAFSDVHLGLVVVGSSSIDPAGLQTIWQAHLARIAGL